MLRSRKQITRSWNVEVMNSVFKEACRVHGGMAHGPPPNLVQGAVCVETGMAVDVTLCLHAAFP